MTSSTWSPGFTEMGRVVQRSPANRSISIRRSEGLSHGMVKVVSRFPDTVPSILRVPKTKAWRRASLKFRFVTRTFNDAGPPPPRKGSLDDRPLAQAPRRRVPSRRRTARIVEIRMRDFLGCAGEASGSLESPSFQVLPEASLRITSG